MSDLASFQARLARDPDLVRLLLRHPRRAVAGWNLDADELETVAAFVGVELAQRDPVAARIALAELFGLLVDVRG